MKYLVALFFLFTPFSMAHSSLFKIMDDYDQTQRDASQASQPDEGYQAVLAHLNIDPTSQEHLEGYLNTIGKEDKLHDLHKAGTHLLSLPAPEGGSYYVKYHEMYADSRALHLLHFAYMLKPGLDPWLSYNYATALILFSDIARKRYDIQKPIKYAYHVYDLWLRELKEKSDFQDLLEEHQDDIPMVTTHVSHQPEDFWSYEEAHRTFYSLLGRKFIEMSDKDEKQIAMAEDTLKRQLTKLERREIIREARQITKGLAAYNPDAKPSKEGPESKTQTSFRSWLAGYELIITPFGPTLFLAQRGGKTLNH